MAKKCEVCGKGYQKGHKVSHAHNVSIKRWFPNLQKVRLAGPKGGVKRAWVCTACIQANKIRKSVA
ncbi:MAG: 50S ribosomal protein L28 [Acidobacteria bacterium]|nr:50S ribosomal protein L28 [Acidobacteriota bacterium]